LNLPEFEPFFIPVNPKAVTQKTMQRPVAASLQSVRPRIAPWIEPRRCSPSANGPTGKMR